MADKLLPMNPKLRDIFRAVYTFRQKYQYPFSGTAFWQQAADDMAVIAARYGNHPFAQALLVAAYEDIEREYRETRPTK